MSVPHPLHQAVLAQVLNDLRSGQLRRCQSMGFSPKSLAAMKRQELVSVLLNAKIRWCTITVNDELVQRLLKQIPNIEQEIAAIDRMLRLGASTEMVSEFHGLNHQEVALRRLVLGLPQRKGRWPVLTESEDANLWKAWQAAVAARGGATDDASMLTVCMELAELRSVPLAVVWSMVRNWLNPGPTQE